MTPFRPPHQARLDEALVKTQALQLEATTLREQTDGEASAAAGEQSVLQDALSEARSADAKWEQEHALQQTAKAQLLEEVHRHVIARHRATASRLPTPPLGGAR